MLCVFLLTLTVFARGSPLETVVNALQAETDAFAATIPVGDATGTKVLSALQGQEQHRTGTVMPTDVEALVVSWTEVPTEAGRQLSAAAIKAQSMGVVQSFITMYVFLCPSLVLD